MCRLLFSFLLALSFLAAVSVAVFAYSESISLGAPAFLDSEFSDVSPCVYDYCGVVVMNGQDGVSVEASYSSLDPRDVVTVAWGLVCVADPAAVGQYVELSLSTYAATDDDYAFSIAPSGISEAGNWDFAFLGSESLMISVGRPSASTAVVTCTFGMDWPYYDVVYPERVSWTWVTDNISGTDSLMLNWDGVGADSYDVYRDGVKVATDTVGASFVDSGLATGEAYGYQVYSKMASGTETPGVYQVFTQGAGDSSPSMPALSLAGTTSALYDLGLLPVISLAAVIFIAFVLYRRFRRSSDPFPGVENYSDSAGRSLPR
jgi:hypothetical protein